MILLYYGFQIPKPNFTTLHPNPIPFLLDIPTLLNINKSNPRIIYQLNTHNLISIDESTLITDGLLGLIDSWNLQYFIVDCVEE